MARRRTRTVWLGKVSASDRSSSQLKLIHERFPQALRRALDPDRRVTYSREGRLSEPRGDERPVSAQLGSRRRRRKEEGDYEETRHEWVSSEAPARQGN